MKTRGNSCVKRTATLYVRRAADARQLPHVETSGKSHVETSGKSHVETSGNSDVKTNANSDVKTRQLPTWRRAATPHVETSNSMSASSYQARGSLVRTLDRRTASAGAPPVCPFCTRLFSSSRSFVFDTSWTRIEREVAKCRAIFSHARCASRGARRTVLDEKIA
ncbi:MAG TPA: hypothetical protein VM261_20760, partial [Kofleriaceae bacterium]|nr:hypothetical protein [Kofleriaceae bacterium]